MAIGEHCAETTATHAKLIQTSWTMRKRLHGDISIECEKKHNSRTQLGSLCSFHAYENDTSGRPDVWSFGHLDVPIGTKLSRYENESRWNRLPRTCMLKHFSTACSMRPKKKDALEHLTIEQRLAMFDVLATL